MTLDTFRPDDPSRTYSIVCEGGMALMIDQKGEMVRDGRSRSRALDLSPLKASGRLVAGGGPAKGRFVPNGGSPAEADATRRHEQEAFEVVTQQGKG